MTDQLQVRTTTAYHEAGHVILGALLGIEWNSVTILPNEDKGLSGEAVQCALPDDRKHPEQVLMLLAGHVAEAKYSGRPTVDNGAKHDMREVMEAIATWDCFTYGRVGADPDPILFGATVTRATQVAMEIVECVWPAIEVFAEVLLERRQLTKPEIDAIAWHLLSPDPERPSGHQIAIPGLGELGLMAGMCKGEKVDISAW